MDAERMLGNLVSGFLGNATQNMMGGDKLNRASSKDYVRRAQRAHAGSSRGRSNSGNQMLNKLKQGMASPQGMMAGLGLAMGAWESFQRSQGNSAVPPMAGGQAPPPVPGAGMPPPMPGAMPPPVPGAAAAPPPMPAAAPPPMPAAAAPPPMPAAAAPPPMPAAAAAPPTPAAAAPAPMNPEQSQSIAIRLIQAMIAAAWCDGEMDDTERARIIDQAGQAGLSEEERQFLETEMAAPKSIEELTAGIDDDGTKRLMYGLSLAAIDTDTFQEFQHIQNLGTALGLDAATMQQMQAQFTGN